jgi:hypothetical protein
MTLVFTVIALVGLIIFAVGAILYLFMKPTQPLHTLLMVVGGLVFAIAEAVLLLDVLF